MKHFELMRFLFVTSFASKPDSAQRAGPAVPPTRVSRCNKLRSAIPRSSPVAAGKTALEAKPTRKQEEQTTEEPKLYGRRRALAALGGSVAFVAGSNNNGASNALDMDAFINRELENDTKNCDPKRDPKCVPKLSADEALCKYGQSGNARGEACKRVKAAGGELPKSGSQGKSLGGAYAM